MSSLTGAASAHQERSGIHRRRHLEALRGPGMGASVLVASISSMFGVLLISATGYLAGLMRSDPALGSSGQLALMLSVLGIILIGLAIYVAAIVTANTFTTVVAGRTRLIALLRLIGASARSQRKVVARQGLLVGLMGSATGLVFGVGVAALLREVANTYVGRPVPYHLLAPVLLVPPVAVTLTTWAAAWAGSRRVLEVTPLQAVSASAEPSREQVVRRPVRNVLALLLVIAGVGLLVLGVLAGLVTPLGVLIAFVGGVLSFTGIAIGATLFVPPALRLVGRCFGDSVPARLAAGNALRHPERSSRMAIGVVIAVTLVTTFGVGLESARGVIQRAFGGQLPPDVDTTLTTVSNVISALIAVSAVIAAVGLVNLLSIGVVQRRRELGLLRALGLSVRQVRRMVLLEAAHIAVTATLLGLVLGVLYGWAGAQATFGSAHLRGASLPLHLVPPAIPWTLVIAVGAATAVLTLAAAVVPTRLATGVTPVNALPEA